MRRPQRARRRPARAPPRRPSGGGAGASTRARRGGAPRRGGRPAPAPRRGAGARGSARRARGRRRTRPRLAPRRVVAPAPAPRSARTTRMPLPPPPATRLDHHGVAVLGAERAQVASSATSSSALEPGHDRHAGRAREPLGPRLVAHQLRSPRRGGPTQASPAPDHGGGEAGVLRQEAVARVHGAGAAGRRRRARAAPRRRGRTARARRRRRVDVQRARVGVREHGDRLPGPARARSAPRAPRSRPRLAMSTRPDHAPSARAITICCTSSVPSPMVRIFASR